MIQKLLSFLTGAPVQMVGEYFKERQRLKNEIKLKTLEGKARLQEAKYAALARKEEQIHTWEMAQIANSGYKDEIVLGVLLMPYVGAFIPGVQDHILVGFQYLDQMPYWAVGLTVTIFLAIYGIRHRNAAKIQAPGLRDKDVGNGSKPDPNG